MATKKERELIFNKYGGRCAYCGCNLEKGWHVDEMLPCRREYKWDRETMKDVFTGYTHPERLNIDNQMPACASCNINKHSESLEGFRSMISNFVNSLNKYSVQYKFAKKYGLVEETPKPVVFYFETIDGVWPEHRTNPYMQPPKQMDDPYNTLSCDHPDCGRFEDHNSQRFLCTAMAQNACAK